MVECDMLKNEMTDEYIVPELTERSLAHTRVVEVNLPPDILQFDLSNAILVHDLHFVSPW